MRPSFALLAAVVSALPAGAQAVRPDSGQFTIYKLQHVVGAETWTRSSGPTATLVAEWAFRYLGSNVSVHDTLAMQADGTPIHFGAHGQTSTLTSVNVDVDVPVGSRVDRFFTTTHYPPAAIEEALFRYWLSHGRPRSLALLPGGQATFEERGRDTIAGTPRVVLHRYSVSGLLWGRQSMWATEDGRIVAVISGDAELDRMEEVRAGFETSLPLFVAGSVRDGLADLANAARATPPIHTGAYAIVGARLIDGTGKAAIDDAVVVVRSGRIEAAGPRATTTIPSGMVRVDATGTTIIPGLWDMHVHFEQVEWPSAQLAAGVTTARDAGNELELAVGLRDAIAAGKVPGPRMLLAGLIDGAPDGLGAFVASTPDEARAIVNRYHAAGYPQIKIYGSLPPALVPVVTAEAHRLGMTVTGHVPRGMDARQFVEAGADQINHFNYVLSLFQRGVPAGQPRPPIDFTTAEAQATIAFFKSHGTVLDPTLARSEQGAHPKDSAFSVYEPGAAHAPLTLLEALNSSGTRSDLAPNRLAGLANTAPLLVALMRAGVPVVTGTDLVVPGHSIARELELYVRAGMTPMEALQSSTIVPARAMGLDRESGTVEAGKRADLVILDGNPLDAISNVRKVRSVVAAGRMFLPAPLWRTAGFTP